LSRVGLDDAIGTHFPQQKKDRGQKLFHWAFTVFHGDVQGSS
jgi:hypothetical protein